MCKIVLHYNYAIDQGEKRIEQTLNLNPPVAEVINFGVTWDRLTNTVGIDSTTNYKEE